LMAEQNFAVAQRMGDLIAVVERGEIALVDTPDAIAADAAVQRRYLGV
jgi:ABC-type branched-subunit amino acid transport system ATPase component